MSIVADIAFPVRLSLQVALTATAAAAVTGVGMAYVLARYHFPGKRLLDVLIMLPMVLPPVVTGYYLLVAFGRTSPLARFVSGLFGVDAGLTFTWWGAAVAAFTVSVPFTIKSARAAIESLDTALLDASATLGRREWETAVFVVLPLARRGIAAGLVLTFARSLGEFGATLMVAGNIPGVTNTMPLEVYNAVIYGDWRSAAVLVAVFTLISGAVLMGANRLAEVRS